MKQGVMATGLLLLFLLGCSSSDHSSAEQETPSLVEASLVNTFSAAGTASEKFNQNPEGNSVSTRIKVPAGYERLNAPEGSVQEYLRQLPTKKEGAAVYLHNGALKNRQDVHAAVIDLEIGKKDLQQCADAVMRLRAEYLFKKKQYAAIHFNFTSGDRADYSKYANGYRAVIKGNKVSWVKKAQPDYSYRTFRQYLDLVFTYAGTASLTKELMPVKSLKDIAAGDVFIQGGFPGHAVMVMDVAVNRKTGQKIFLLSQSYMPAQQIHVLKNQNDTNLSPWYSALTQGKIYTPEWTFNSSDLKRFPAW